MLPWLPTVTGPGVVAGAAAAADRELDVVGRARRGREPVERSRIAGAAGAAAAADALREDAVGLAGIGHQRTELVTSTAPPTLPAAPLPPTAIPTLTCAEPPDWLVAEGEAAGHPAMPAAAADALGEDGVRVVLRVRGRIVGLPVVTAPVLVTDTAPALPPAPPLPPSVRFKVLLLLKTMLPAMARPPRPPLPPMLCAEIADRLVAQRRDRRRCW